ncbi:hypothetical protein ACEPAF_2134 [Sanghuangporus sanghuang]
MVGISKGKRASRISLSKARERLPLAEKTNSWGLGTQGVQRDSTSHPMTRTYTGSINKSIEELKVKEQQLTKKALGLEEELLSSNSTLTAMSKRLQGSNNRLRKYQSDFFNGRKTIDRLRKSISALRNDNQLLNSENSQLKAQLACREYEETRLHALCDWYRSMFDASHFRAMEHWNNFIAADNRCLMLLKRMSSLSDTAARLQSSLEDSRRQNHRWRSRLAYARKRIQGLQSTKNGIEKFLRLTDKGVYTSTTRSLILRLRQLGCPGKATGAALDAVIQTITSFLGMDRRKRRKKVVSARTVGRIITEAGVMSMMQLGYDLKRCDSFTSGGDGTTNKHENFDATNINVASQTMQSSEFDTEPTKSMQHDVRFVKVEHLGNHTAETQKNTFIDGLQEAINVFNRSPLGQACNTPGAVLNEPTLAMKYTGTHGDHAEDQKAKHRMLGEWKRDLSMRGVGAKYLQSKTEEEQEILTREAQAELINRMGGEAAWQALGDEERASLQVELFSKICESLFPEAIEHLSESERRFLSLWVWAGCGMHKDLNAVKGGDSAMRAKWIELGVSPISLPNKENAAVLEALGPCDDEIDGEEIETDMDPFNASATAAASAAMLQSHQIEGSQRGEAQQQHHLQNSSGAFAIAHGPVRMVVKQAKESTQGGAVKFLILLGMYVNHKDDKKGQQHTFRNYAIRILKLEFTYPDTSNTRYSSYLEAAVHVLPNRQMYINFLLRVCALKEKRTWTNLEENLLKGLNDWATMTELAVLVLYREAVSLHYIASV